MISRALRVLDGSRYHSDAAFARFVRLNVTAAPRDTCVLAFLLEQCTSTAAADADAERLRALVDVCGDVAACVAHEKTVTTVREALEHHVRGQVEHANARYASTRAFFLRQLDVVSTAEQDEHRESAACTDSESLTSALDHATTDSIIASLGAATLHTTAASSRVELSASAQHARSVADEARAALVVASVDMRYHERCAFEWRMYEYALTTLQWVCENRALLLSDTSLDTLKTRSSLVEALMVCVQTSYAARAYLCDEHPEHALRTPHTPLGYRARWAFFAALQALFYKRVRDTLDTRQFLEALRYAYAYEMVVDARAPPPLPLLPNCREYVP